MTFLFILTGGFRGRGRGRRNNRGGGGFRGGRGHGPPGPPVKPPPLPIEVLGLVLIASFPFGKNQCNERFENLPNASPGAP